MSPVSTRLSIVLPTYNERANIGPLVQSLLALEADYELEILCVDDDSADGTAAEVVALSRQHRCLRLIRRVGRTGLSSAIKEGIL
ncbi:MAG: glycosyltransferase, partial [Cyanobium sp.]